MSLFDPNTFLDTSVDAVFETKFVPIPEDWYRATITDLKAQTGSKDGKHWVRLEPIWQIEGEDELAKKLARTEMLVKQSFFVDLTEEGAFAVGTNQNLQLGQLCDAVGQNKPGPWKPANLLGRSAKIYVSVKSSEKTGREYNEVTKVAKA